MNGRVAKTLREFARVKRLRFNKVKKTFEDIPQSERGQLLAQIRQMIWEAKK